MRLIEVLSALGAAQGVLLLLLIAFRFRYHKNLPLSVLVVALAVRLGTIPSWNETALLSHSWLLPVATPLPFLFGFLVWWYVRELRAVEDAVPPLLGLHFLPYLLETVAIAVTVYTMSAPEYRLFVGRIFLGTPPRWMLIRNGLKVALSVLYMGAAVRVAFRPAAGIAPGRQTWMRVVALAPWLSLAAFAVVALHPPATAALAEGRSLPFALVAAGLLIIIYALSLLTLFSPDALAPGCVDVGTEGDSARSEKDSAADSDDCHALAQRAHDRLRSGAFQDPQLTVRRMARELRVHPNRLSHAVNLTFGASFPQVVNGMRVEYFLSRVREGAADHQNILSLAMDAGFPAKSTFNRVFKEVTGSAPSDFIVHHEE